MKQLVSTILMLILGCTQANSQGYFVDTSFRISEYITGDSPFGSYPSPRVRQLITFNDTVYVATGQFGVYDELNGNWLGENMVWFDDKGNVRKPCLFTHDTTYNTRAVAFKNGYYNYIRSSNPFIQRISINDCLYDSAFVNQDFNWFQSPINFTTYATGVFFESGSAFYGGFYDKQLGDTTVQSCMFKINHNGEFDTNFYAQVTRYNAPIGLTQYSDDKMLVYSGMTELDGHYSNGIFLIDTLGNVDTNFSCDIYNSGIGGIGYAKLLSDGKIMVFGEFIFDSTWTELAYMVRLNPNGTLDTTFNTQLHRIYQNFPHLPNGLQRTFDMLETKWGTYLFVGSLDSLQGHKFPYIFETDKQGNIIPTKFNFSLGDTLGFDTIEDCAIFANCYMELNRILYTNADSNSFIVAGGFHTLNGKPHAPIFKLNRYGLAIDEYAMQDAMHVKIFPNPAKDSFTLEFGESDKRRLIKVSLVSLLGKELKSWNIDLRHGFKHELILPEVSAGHYIVRLISKNLVSTKQLIISD